MTNPELELENPMKFLRRKIINELKLFGYSGMTMRNYVEAATDLKHKTILMTFYATGMRLEELQLFRVQNIDSQRMTLKFMGKGKRERYVPLSPVLLAQLRAYWKVYKPKDIFFSSKFQRPYHRRSIQCIFADVKKLAEIKKPGGVHMLRHSFATHLFEANVQAFTIKKSWGTSGGGASTRALFPCLLHLAA